MLAYSIDGRLLNYFPVQDLVNMLFQVLLGMLNKGKNPSVIFNTSSYMYLVLN